MSHTLYTIEFDQDDTLYYYVGITTDYNKRMEAHVKGSGAMWIKRNFTEDTRRNAKSQVIGKFTQNAKWEETKKTLELMVMHGINNVQGAKIMYYVLLCILIKYYGRYYLAIIIKVCT